MERFFKKRQRRNRANENVYLGKATTKEGTTTVTFDRDGMTLVVKDVPAQVCTNCGEDYVDEHVAHEILAIAERMAKSGAQVDVRRLSSRLCHAMLTNFFLCNNFNAPGHPNQPPAGFHPLPKSRLIRTLMPVTLPNMTSPIPAGEPAIIPARFLCFSEL
ncbi:MAG: type II toxin-antitoxin system MqsA family antitoxin [Methanoregula sp.]|nr:type II toxin-antitoxin system MqsA family antitoxin [Methanoregula sp.]